MNVTIQSLAEMEKAAKEFLASLQSWVELQQSQQPKRSFQPQESRQNFQSHACIVGLSGNLGAGKTTFTQAIARALGITENVTSPTFVIEKIYATTHPLFKKLIHIDAYRLEKAGELEKLGWKDISARPENLILVEWPEKITPLLPSSLPCVTFTHVHETVREMTVNFEGKIEGTTSI